MSAAAMRLHQFAAAAAGMLPFTGRYHSDVCAAIAKPKGCAPLDSCSAGARLRCCTLR